jgi:hypothetical protein
MRPLHLTALLSLAVLTCGTFLRAADHPLDKEGVWTLELRVQNMRTITVDVPGQGKKTFHYLRYEIVNNTGEARQAEPAFELMTHDKQGTYKEVTNADVFKAIVNQEDPDGKLDLKDSAAVAKKPVPPAKKDAVPPVVHGLALWEGVDPTSHHFSVFVAGLSNGRVTDESKNVRRKTLQLNFKAGDETIKFVAPPQWLYRVDKAVTEKKDKQPQPQPRPSLTEQKREALNQKIAAVVAEMDKLTKELQERKEKLNKASEEVRAVEASIKKRPAGDTPELRAQDLQRLRKLWATLDDPKSDCAECSDRLSALTRRLDDLERQKSKP